MLDPLTLTAAEAQQLLDNGKTTSVSLVEMYLDQIERHNHSGLHLNALISIAPKDKLLKTAKKLDNERQSGQVRGSLHGIPIVIKDLFATKGLGLPTTAGTPSLQTATASRTAPVIQHLMDCGLIIIGTANLTEFCGLKYKGITPGWSPMGGQTQSPYVFGGLEKDEKMLGNSSIGGSSSGSASAVAAGFCPWSIGTECCGSLITPANRAGLYALKCGLNTVNAEGMFHYTNCIDFVGGMTKSVRDLNLLTTALMQKPETFDVDGGFRGLRIGFCNAAEWRLPVEVCSWPGDTWKDIETAYADAIAEMRNQEATVYENVDLPLAWDAFKIDGKSPFYEIAFYELKNQTMGLFLDEFAESPVRSVEDIIKYNGQHRSKCLPEAHPNQSELHDLATNNTTAEEYQAMVTELRIRGQNGLGRLFEKMDVVVGLTDSPLCMYSTAIGGPIACMPLGTIKYSGDNERPFGLCAAAPTGGEGLLLRLMSAVEAAFPARPLPRPLLRGSAADAG